MFVEFAAAAQEVARLAEHYWIPVVTLSFGFFKARSMLRSEASRNQTSPRVRQGQKFQKHFCQSWPRAGQRWGLGGD